MTEGPTSRVGIAPLREIDRRDLDTAGIKTRIDGRSFWLGSLRVVSGRMRLITSHMICRTRRHRVSLRSARRSIPRTLQGRLRMTQRSGRSSLTSRRPICRAQTSYHTTTRCLGLAALMFKTQSTRQRVRSKPSMQLTYRRAIRYQPYKVQCLGIRPT